MASGALVQCTFYGNAAPYGGNVSSDCSGSVDMDGCIVAASTEGEGFFRDGTSQATITCSDIHGNAGGDWVGGIADQYGLDGNICLDPFFCDPGAGDFTLTEGSPCLPDFNPECGQIGAFPQGCSGPSPVPGEADLVAGFRLVNFPNPFNPITTIRFDLPGPGPVSLRVFTVAGRPVATLLEGPVATGRHEVSWDGRDGEGRLLPSGTYFCRLEAGAVSLTRSLVLLK